ncbi:MAG: DegV family protein [Clostridia bacterium]|nr:DegV family protein [Clostridia bacterium]
MRDFVIFTDSATDLTKEMAASLGVQTIQLEVIMDGEEPKPNDCVEPKAFYADLRAKKGATTAAVNIDRFLDSFGKVLEEKDVDLLYLGFSSGLSGTFNAGAVALKELSEKYPDRKLYAVDTLCASMGQGLLVYYAAKKKESGEDIDAVRDYVENTKMNLCHWFTVDDLFFLKRGGRVSAATAVVGTMLGIKPVMHVDNAGKLTKVTTARGRKASIDALFERMKGSVLPEGNSAIFISHGDCEDDAQYLANRIRTELGYAQIEINFVGPVIGAHSGPGTLALFFLGNER